MIQAQHIAKALMSMIEEDNKDPDKVAEDFIAFMKKYGMENRVDSVLRHMESLSQGDSEALEVELADKVLDETLEKISRFIGVDVPADKIKYNEQLIAGFRAYSEGKLYEANIANRLEALRSALKN